MSSETALVPYETSQPEVPQGTEVHAAMYEIMQKMAEDISTDSLQYIDREVNLNNVDAVDNWEIEFPERDLWWWPAKAFLAVGYVIRTLGDNDYTASDNISIQNNGAGLFSRAELLIDNNIVEAVDFVHIQNTVRNLVYYSAEYSSTVAKSSHWYPDTTSTALIDYRVPISAGADISLYSAGTDLVNMGHRALWKANLASKINMISIPLASLFGLFKTMDTVTKGLNIKIRLFRNAPNDVIFKGNNLTGVGAGTPPADGKVVFTKISLWMPRVKPHNSVLARLEPLLRREENVDIPFVDTQIFRTGKQSAAQNGEIFYQLKTKRRRPVKAFVCFQLATRVEGGQTICKRVFDNIGIRSLRAVLNSGTQYPERPYLPSFAAASTDISRVYEEFLRCGLKQHDGISGALVDFDSFQSLFTIFCIDMSEQPDYATKPESATLDLYWQHTAGADYYMWVLVEAERKLQVIGTGGTMKLVRAV